MGWIDALSGDKHKRSDEKDEKFWQRCRNILPIQAVQVNDDIFAFADSYSPPHLFALTISFVGAFGFGVMVGRKSSKIFLFRRITNVQVLSDNHIGPQSNTLQGRAVSVSDGDTFRFYHKPSWFHSSIPDIDAKLSDQTIPIRICTIDTPEVAKFGKPSQPFGDDAKKLLSKHILDRPVRIKILKLDQYGRAVASVWYRPWSLLPFFSNQVDEVMLQAGLAEVYRGSGAIYGKRGRDYYLQLEQQARINKVGMWSQPNRESAAEFKARMKEDH